MSGSSPIDMQFGGTPPAVLTVDSKGRTYCLSEGGKMVQVHMAHHRVQALLSMTGPNHLIGVIGVLCAELAARAEAIS